MRFRSLRLVAQCLVQSNSWCDIGKLLGKPARVIEELTTYCSVSLSRTLGVTSVYFWENPRVCLKGLRLIAQSRSAGFVGVTSVNFWGNPTRVTERLKADCSGSCSRTLGVTSVIFGETRACD